MILVDYRIGSKQLISYLKELGGSKICQTWEQEFGDFEISGYGPSGHTAVGVERKTITDLLTCIRDGRLSGFQLPGLLEQYQYPCIIVEGLWRPEPTTGILQTMTSHGWQDLKFGKKGFTYSEISKYLISLQLCAGVRVFRSSGMAETAKILVDLHTWFQEPWSDHEAHLPKFVAPPPPELLDLRGHKPNMVMRVANQIHGFGWKKCVAVAKRFETVHEMVTSNTQEWLHPQIPGIGKELAERAVRSFQEKE